MAFNWAGGAAGAQDGLESLIKRQLLEREMANREDQVREQSKYRETQQELLRQNSEVLNEQRRLRTETMQAEADRKTQVAEWADSVLTSPDTVLAGLDDETRRRMLRRAQYIKVTGEDIPASEWLKPTEAEILSLKDKEAAINAKYRKPDKDPAADGWDEAKYGPKDLPTKVQLYLVELRRKHATPEAALAEFDRNLAGVTQGNRYMDPADVRDALIRLYKPPQQGKKSYQDYVSTGIVPQIAK